MNKLTNLYIILLTTVVGLELTKKIPRRLYTFVTAVSSFLHGVLLVGAMIILDQSETRLEVGLALLALFLSAINFIGGFLVIWNSLSKYLNKK